MKEGQQKEKELAYNVTDEDLGSNPNDPDWKNRLCSSLLTYLYCRVIVRMKAGVGGDEQSQTEVRADFRNDPGIVTRRLCQRRFGFSLSFEFDFFLCNPHTRVFSAIRPNGRG